MHARLTGICLISSDVSSLAAFYAAVLDTCVSGDDVFASVSATGATLSIYSAAGLEQMAPESLAGAGSGNLTLEFEVDDVDVCYKRLLAQAVPIVKPPTTQPWGKPPTTQPWGRRSVWLRDPEGNIVNLYQPVPPLPHPAKIATEYFHRLLAQRELSVCDEMLSNAYVDHDAPEGSPGPQATRDYIADMFTDYPDLRFTVDDLVTLDRYVAIRARWHGTHRETGAVLHQAGLVLLRLNESGQLAERRSTYTDLAKPAE